jgi:hypothetical protein
MQALGIEFVLSDPRRREMQRVAPNVCSPRCAGCVRGGLLSPAKAEDCQSSRDMQHQADQSHNDGGGQPHSRSRFQNSGRATRMSWPRMARPNRPDRTARADRPEGKRRHRQVSFQKCKITCCLLSARNFYCIGYFPATRVAIPLFKPCPGLTLDEG